MEKRLPDAFVERIRRQRVDAEEFLAAIGREPWLSIRQNPFKQPACGLGLEMGDGVPWCPDGHYLASRPLFTKMPSFHAGAFYVQEASSMSLSVALAAAAPLLPPCPVCLDMCAAPGGKTTLLISRLGERGVVVANEVVRQRAWVLRENVAKWGCPSAIVTNKTAEQVAASGLRFDLVAVDAPCSGEGMFRKDQTAVDEWSAKAAADCATRQRDILSRIWPALQTGGLLIYSTCTFNPEENEKNVEWTAAELGAEVLPMPMPDGVGIETLLTAAGPAYAFYPNKVRGEGLFICLLRKTSASAPQPRQKLNRGKGQPSQDLKEVAAGREYVNGVKIYRRGAELMGFPVAQSAAMARVVEALDPLLCGVPIGALTVKKGVETLTPSAELPLSLAYRSGALPEEELGEADALKFLHGDADIRLPQGPDGWCVVANQGLRLGLVKRIGRRINNYYPKEWRIRMSVD